MCQATRARSDRVRRRSEGSSRLTRGCGSRRRSPRPLLPPPRGASRAAPGSAPPRGRCRSAAVGASSIAASSPSSHSSSASQSVTSAARRSRITGACTSARSRSDTIVTTTSVVVRTPGVASRCSACSLRIASADDHHGIAELGHRRVDVDQVECDPRRDVEPCPQDREHLGGDAAEREQLVGLRDRARSPRSRPDPRCSCRHGVERLADREHTGRAR